MEIVRAQIPEAIMIAGDVFDRSAPSAETVALMDDFLTKLAAFNIPILMIAGNHDSPERIAYGGRIMEHCGIYLSPVYDGTVKSVRLSDEHGEVCFWLLPFLHPWDVRMHYPEIKPNANDALRTVIDSMELDGSVRNVLIAHQFVAGMSVAGSEETYCGTAEQVSAEVFAPFEYTALGHLHNPKNVGSPRIRYCGTPLKYSISEANSNKTVTIVELGEKGCEPVITEIPLKPKRDMKKLYGSFDELMRGTDEDYVHVLLTDPTDVTDAMGKLRMRYPFILGMDYARNKTVTPDVLESLQREPEQEPEELFSAFFEKMLSIKMNTQQTQIIHDLVESIWKKEENA